MGVVTLAALATLLYLTGSRFFPGAGTPPRQTQQSLDEQAAAISAHRRAQQLARPVPDPTAQPSSTDSRAQSEIEHALATPASASPPYWTDFRGPHRDGHYRERPILTNWPSAGLRPLWKQPVGGGHASFVMAEGRAFTIEQRGSEELVAAYEVAAGREIWTNAWRALFSEHYGGVGPRSTPTWHAGILFALGAMGELRAFDAATGKVRWRTNILDDAGASNLEWGMAASPLVVGNVVIVVPGGSGGRTIVAYDRQSGTRVWSALDERAGYSSQMAASLAGVEQILTFTGATLASLSLDGARVLWQFPWPTQTGINVAQPLVLDGNRVFLSSGYGMGAALIEVSRDGDTFAIREVWRTNRMKNQFTSSVHHEGFIYGLDEAILACLDAATGALKWKGGRYGYGQVILASGHLVILSEDGDLALVRATPERHVEIARFPVLSGRTWNHPAIADGYLMVRNASEMAAFDLRIPR